MGACAGPSVIRTLLGACGLRSLKLHFPHALDLGLLPATPPQEHGSAKWRGDWSCCCRRIPQTAPKDIFLFEKILLLNPATLYKEGSVLLHSPPLQLDWDSMGQGPTWPHSHLSPAGAHSLPVFITSSLFPSLRLQATRSLSVLLKHRS